MRSIPWAKVNIKVLLIEVIQMGKIFDGKIEDLDKLMEENGYKFFSKIHFNHVYVKKELKPRFRNIVFNKFLEPK